MGRQVVITSKTEGDLGDSDWLVFEASKFIDEESAREFGERLRLLLEVTGLVTSPGVDTGEDTPEGSFGKAMQPCIPPGYRIKDEVFGLQLYADDDKVAFVSARVGVETVASMEHYFGPLKELSFQPLELIGRRLQESIQYINFAKVAEHHLSRIVLAFAAVERLGQAHSQSWSSEEKEYLRKLSDQCESDQQFLVAKAFGRLHSAGLSEGVRGLLAKIDLSHLSDEWVELYARRSKLLHGRDVYPFTYTDRRVSELSNEVIWFASKVILRLIERESIRIPDIAKINLWGQPKTKQSVSR